MDYLPQVDVVEERLGYVFANKELLVSSLTHRSFVNEHKGFGSHNERLEFLGDSVLGLAVSDYLYRRLPEHPEGVLSQLRSKLVDAVSCAAYLRTLRLEEFILLGRGEQMTEGRTKNSICADAFEAVVGAIYLDGGLAITKSFLLCHFEGVFEAAIDSPPRNYKAELQDYTQKKFQSIPVYKVAQESGPDHAKIFHVMVYVDSQEAGLGLGSSKKEAEQRAAFAALSKIS
jgi:ribonuclease-3